MTDGTEAAIQKLAAELPENAEVTLHIERGAGWVVLRSTAPHEDIEEDIRMVDDGTVGDTLLKALQRAIELDPTAPPP